MIKKVVVFLVVLLFVGCSRGVEKNQVYIIDDDKVSVNVMDLDILVKGDSELLFTYQSFLYKQLKKYEEENDININYYYEFGDDNNGEEVEGKIDLIVSGYSDEWLDNIDWGEYYNKKDIVLGIPEYFDNEYIIPFSLQKPGYLLRKSQLNMIYEKESDYEELSYQDLYRNWVATYDIDIDLEDDANRIISNAFPGINDYTDFDIQKTISFIKDITQSVSESTVEAWLLETEKYGYSYSYDELKFLMFNNINRAADFYSQAIFEEMNPNVLNGAMNKMYHGYGAFLVRDGDDVSLDVEGLIVPLDTDNLYQVKKISNYLLNKENQLEFFKGINDKHRYYFTPIYVDLYEKMNEFDDINGYDNIAKDARVKLKKDLESGKGVFSQPFNRDGVIKLRKYHMAVFDFIKEGNYSSDNYIILEELLKDILFISK